MNLPARYRFHLLGLHHLPVSSTFQSCAFTTKIWRLSKMLLSLGHETIVYGAEGSDVPCTEFVQTHTLSDIRQEWGSGDNRPECDGLGYPWRETGFRHDFNTNPTITTIKARKTIVGAIKRRKRPDDFLLVMQGMYQKPIADKLDMFLTVEPGIGYRGSYARFRAFESAYLQNFTYGSENPRQSINGHYYDRVIPNYFDPKDFPLETEKDDYFLYIGRLIHRKGVDTAIKTVEAIGGRLVIAGQGSVAEMVDPAEAYLLNSDCWEYVGYADAERRAELMGKAKAVFVPTKYLEAFGGVNVEAQLCGTPIITTNFGVFPETVLDGTTGYRCNTLADFVDAARAVGDLDPHEIRRHAERYLMDNVKMEFQRWFDDLFRLFLSAMNPGLQGWHYYD